MTSTELVLAHNVPRRPRSPGVGPLGLIATAVFFVCAVVFVLLFTFIGLPTGMVFGAFSLLFLGAVSWKDRHGRSTLERASGRVQHWRKVRTGADLYHPGTLTQLGSHLLPGVAASSTLSEDIDSYGRRYAMITYPDTGHHVVVIKASPDGASLLDPAVSAKQVEKFGDWLSSLAYEPNLVQAAVSIEIAPDAAPALIREIGSQEKQWAPRLAKDTLQQIAAQYPVGGSSSHATVSLTFMTPPGTDRAGRKDSGAAVTRRRLASRLPQILADLPGTGAGPVYLMGADELIETVRCAYNPADRQLYQDLRAKGEPAPVTLWNSAGPTAAKEEWASYRHGSATSVVWEKTGFTSSQVNSRAMAPLLQDSEDVDVMRVTWLWRPISPAASAVIAENDFNAADHRVVNAKNGRPSARSTHDLVLADSTRKAEASGAALLNFAILVTATVMDGDKLANAEAALDHLGPAARLHLRRMDGSMAPAFAAGIAALGLVTDAHLTIPTSIRTGL